MTTHMVRRWSAVLLLAAAWLLLQQGAWRHTLSHEVPHQAAYQASQPPLQHHADHAHDRTHDHSSDHPKAHGLCTLCLSLQAAHAALPAAPALMLPALAHGLARPARAWLAHSPATHWHPPSRAPPMTTLH